MAAPSRVTVLFECHMVVSIIMQSFLVSTSYFHTMALPSRWPIAVVFIAWLYQVVFRFIKFPYGWFIQLSQGGSMPLPTYASQLLNRSTSCWLTFVVFVFDVVCKPIPYPNSDILRHILLFMLCRYSNVHFVVAVLHLQSAQTPASNGWKLCI